MSKAILKKGLGLQAVALVALAAVIAASAIFVSATPAEAQATPGTASPGATVIVSFEGATGATEADAHRFRISEDSDGTATFANGGQSITCYVGSPTGCDANATTAGIQLRVKIADDSPLGQIFVQLVTRARGEFSVTTEHAISVVAANPPVAIRAYGTPPAASLPAVTASDATFGLADGTGGTVVGSQLVNARGVGIAGTNILVTTTRGVLNSTHVPTTTPETTCASVSACTLTTQAVGAGPDGDIAATADNTPAGIVQVRLSGNGATGTATVTFRELRSGLTRSVNVVMHGDAATISAEVDEHTIAVGGSTFVVVTVLDADGNPVVGAQDASFRTNKPQVPAVVGPDVPAGQSAIRLTHKLDVDRDLPGDDNDLPSCGLRAEVPADTTATPPTAAVPGSNGTNTAGKCVIQITAPGDNIDGNDKGPADDATRGTHTLTVGTSNAEIKTVSVEVTVGGAPASISSDAPASVEPLSSTKITVTVLDDAGERVGAVAATVVKVEGSGEVTDGIPSGMTSDGRGTFTYLAPLTPGQAVFLVRAGEGDAQIRQTIQLQIGEPEAEVEEAPAAISMQLRAGGFLYAVTADGPSTTARALFGDAVTVAWKYNADTGMWDASYIPSRAGSNFTISTGDILYVNSPIDQTVGG